MAVIVRVTVPNLVNARAHYIAQVLRVPVKEAVGAMLLSAVEASDLDDQLTAVRNILSQYRLALTEDLDQSLIPED